MGLDPYCAVHLHGKVCTEWDEGGKGKGVLVPITSSVPTSSVPLSFIKSRYEPRRFRLPSANVYPRVLPPYPSVIGASSASRFLPPPPIVDLGNRDDKHRLLGSGLDRTPAAELACATGTPEPQPDQWDYRLSCHDRGNAGRRTCRHSSPTQTGLILSQGIRRRTIQIGVYRRRF